MALPLFRDLDAATAGLTMDWTSGSIEGAVNRIKRIKRQLYGRAGFELPHKMILLQQCIARVPARRFPARSQTVLPVPVLPVARATGRTVPGEAQFHQHRRPLTTSWVTPMA
ncbi:hypothetical protein RFN58_00380 [Streptomyces iakyrus]|uniref:hypothetical protein n=1 Tax=Streptomyces iakyrus TaxID=68219 RepID=UPI0012FED71C|nr:hypothetical protein [Streptomyces iakyrus]